MAFQSPGHKDRHLLSFIESTWSFFYVHFYSSVTYIPKGAFTTFYTQKEPSV